MLEKKIIEIVRKSIKTSSSSSRKKNLDQKKLINLLNSEFIFLSLDGEALSKVKIRLGIQSLITENILEESGYLDEFMINETVFASDLLKKFTLEKND